MLTVSFFYLQPLKPKLTRKIVSSAKLNINRYWHKFEELISIDTNHKSYNTDSVKLRLLPPIVSTKTKRTGSYRQADDATSPLLPFNQNNIQAEIDTFMSKRFTVEKNFARSSMYKHFNDESLYHGVNLNVPRQRCSCSGPLPMSPKYQFTHRNIQLSYEDKENLENEAMEVFGNLAFESSF